MVNVRFILKHRIIFAFDSFRHFVNVLLVEIVYTFQEKRIELPASLVCAVYRELIVLFDF